MFFLLSFQKIPLQHPLKPLFKVNNETYGKSTSVLAVTRFRHPFSQECLLVIHSGQTMLRPIRDTPIYIADGHQGHLHVSISFFWGKLCVEKETGQRDQNR
jgi:hypothetical protein